MLVEKQTSTSILFSYAEHKKMKFWGKKFNIM